MNQEDNVLDELATVEVRLNDHEDHQKEVRPCRQAASIDDHTVQTLGDQNFSPSFRWECWKKKNFLTKIQRYL